MSFCLFLLCRKSISTFLSETEWLHRVQKRASKYLLEGPLCQALHVLINQTRAALTGVVYGVQTRSLLSLIIFSLHMDAGVLTNLKSSSTFCFVLKSPVTASKQVGYGDLHPAGTVPERLWAIFNGACAAVCLGYVVGKITSLVFARSERRTQLRERFDVLHR